MTVRKPTRKERYFLYNTLSGVLKALEGKYTNVDLYNDSVVTGKIKHSDAFMNLNMEDVMFTDSRGNQQLFDSFFIKARNVRYVHIPKGLPIEEMTQKQVDLQPIISNKKPRTFKTKRAQQYQQETLREIDQASTSHQQ